LKVKSAVIANGLQTITSFAEKPMPVSLAAKMLRLAEDLVKENNIIEKQRQLIIEKYADKDEQGQLIINDGNVSFKENNAAKEAQDELNELANLEIDIANRGITEEDLINANLQLTMSQFAVLKNFIEEK
jgi:ArsR family metal-binding transcriptional regulator